MKEKTLNIQNKQFASYVIQKYERLERKVLSHLNIYPSNNNYEDYFQEVCITLWKLACEYDSLEEFEAACPVPFIFQRLKWRVIDLIRNEVRNKEDVCEDEQLTGYLSQARFEDEADFYLALNEVCQHLSAKHQKYLQCLMEKNHCSRQTRSYYRKQLRPIFSEILNRKS